MQKLWMPTFKEENRRWMFWLARLFGKKLCGGIYVWRGRWWIVGEVEEPDPMKRPHSGSD